MASLSDRLFRLPPRADDVRADDLLDAFLDWVKETGLTLYAAQEEALLEIFGGNNVILATPTGSGKSLVATAACFRALAKQERAFYTCPIKALVSEKFFDLCRVFGAENVGMLTGDAAVNRDAPIVCCTAEILANMALREGDMADVGHVVMDEFHYYADRDRGWAWQVPLLTMSQARYLLMSATIGPTEAFEKCLTELNGLPTAVVRSKERPVPLAFEYSEKPIHELLQSLVTRGRAPVYLVHFTQRAAAEQAQNLLSVDFCSKEEKKAIAEQLVGVRWQSPYAKEIQRFIRHGVGLHHAGLLPKYRLLVEKLAQKGLLKVVCGTDTLGVGVNVPIRTVVFTQLCKYDGEKTSILSVRDFQQISGRAGRKGFDDEGFVVAQAPEHVIENLRLEAKASSDPAKRRKIVKKKPPERGYAHWDKATFERLVASEPEPLVSRFQVTHGMILEVLGREHGGCRALVRLLRASHERPVQKRALGKTARAMFRSLVAAQILEPVPGQRKVRVHVDLQEDFSLHHALSLYLVETVDLLDRESPTFALDLLSLVESILENPDLILNRQVDKLKTAKMFELKAAGVEYEERMAELEKIEYPKPNREFVYETFNAFAKRHPWASDNIRPKSIAREMYESWQSFSDYVKDYGIERAEGLLLRYLTDAYKVMAQGVPDGVKDEQFEEIQAYVGAMVRSIDSSLLDEWERMRTGAPPAALAPGGDEAPRGEADVTRDAKGFSVLVRNAVFGMVRAIARRDWDAAIGLCEPTEDGWTARRLEEAFAGYWDEHRRVRTDPPAHRPELTRVERGETRWRVEQALLGDEEVSEWRLVLDVDLGASRVAGRPVLRLEHAGT